MKRTKFHPIETGAKLFHEFQRGRWFREAQNYLSNSDKMNKLLHLVLHLFRVQALAPVLKDILLLYYYVQDIVKGRYKNYNQAKLILVVALLIYIVTPFDLIPDWIPGAGYLDDIALLGYVVKIVEKELDKYYKWSQDSRKAEESPTAENA